MTVKFNRILTPAQTGNSSTSYIVDIYSEVNGTSVTDHAEMGYDRCSRNWVVQLKDRNDCQIGSANYSGRREDAEVFVTELLTSRYPASPRPELLIDKTTRRRIEMTRRPHLRRAQKAQTNPKQTVLINDYTKVVQHFGYLYERWCDESEYEDFNEYVESMKSQLPAGSTEVRMTRDPFACTYQLNGRAMFLRASAFGIRYSEPGVH